MVLKKTSKILSRQEVPTEIISGDAEELTAKRGYGRHRKVFNRNSPPKTKGLSGGAGRAKAKSTLIHQ